jgi:DNA mismatch repair ATPase MutS
MYTGEIHDIFNTVAGHSDQVWHYRQMLLVATQLPETVGRIEIANSDLREVARNGVHRLSALHRIVRLLNARRDSFMGILYFVGQVLLLIHVHLLGWLEVWQRRWGHESAAWFEALGQLEALASLATAAYDHPEWSFATIDASALTFRAEALGHPLLPNEQRVTNDVDVGPSATFLLVTGSNMSGKSTLLRSIGVNALLAQAGGPVCAKQLVLPPLELETSMRISDSLADGVSFFLAELKRLKEIVEHARSVRASQRQLMYLLDEILQGTNSRERQLAVIRVIGHLLEQGAIGAVTTHDLELATTEPLRSACTVVHFRESFKTTDGQQSMTFDYKLRPGVAPTTNALVLLEMVGLK